MKKCLSMILSLIMLLSCFSTIISAKTNEERDSHFSSIIEQEVMNGALFDGKALTYSLSNNVEDTRIVDLELNYDSVTNTMNIVAKLNSSNQSLSVVANGLMYNRQHVNYSMSYIGDLQTQSNNFTVTYFEIYYDTSAKASIYIENNKTGNVVHAVAEINNTLLSKVNLVAESNLLDENQYMNLIFYNIKSPNHAINNSEEFNTYTIQGIIEENASMDSNGVQVANSYLDDWITLFNAMNNNQSLYFNNYNVPQDFFTDVTTTHASKQWKTYVPSSNSFDYRIVRCAIYSIYSGTYSFYFAMIRPYVYETGSMSFGFVQRENETTISNFSYRTEMTLSTKKLRYVADRGMKFYPSIAVTLDSGTFKRAALRIELADVNNAYDLLMFTIGQIPQTAVISTIADILDLISLNPATQQQDNSLIWVKSSTDSDVTAFVLELDDQGIYKSGDQIEIDATMENWNTLRYFWSYSVVLP